MISYKYQTWQCCRCCKEFQLYICRQWQKALNRPWSVPTFRRRDIAILLVLTLHYGNQERPNLKLSDNSKVSENFLFILIYSFGFNVGKFVIIFYFFFFITYYLLWMLRLSGIRKKTPEWWVKEKDLPLNLHFSLSIIQNNSAGQTWYKFVIHLYTEETDNIVILNRHQQLIDRKTLNQSTWGYIKLRTFL